MKKILIILIFPIIGFSQGIEFKNETLYQLLSKAKTENKLIFIDAYASWCGPCKNMNKFVFPDVAVGTYFNSNFINAKFNMEEGEGLTLAKEYQVNAYPTFLFIDGNGKLIYKTVGYLEPEQLIDAGNLALNPDKQLHNQIEKFNSGNRDTEFLYELSMNAMQNNDENAITYARAYYKKVDNLLTYNCIALMYNTIDKSTPQTEEFSFFQNNEVEINKVIKTNEVTEILDEIVYDYAKKEINDNESIPDRAKKIENVIAKYRPNQAVDLSYFYGMTYSNFENDYKLYEKYAINYMDRNYKNVNSTFLNETAWRFFEIITNETSLEQALKWAIQSVNISSTSYNNDTVAHLYYKLGDKNNARIYAEISIKTGKENGDDTSTTEALLSKL